MEHLKLEMDGLTYSPTVSMKMNVGRDLTARKNEEELLSLDNYLLDADVVSIIENCHEEALKDGSIYHEEILHRFFRSDRTVEEIHGLFSN